MTQAVATWQGENGASTALRNITKRLSQSLQTRRKSSILQVKEKLLRAARQKEMPALVNNVDARIDEHRRMQEYLERATACAQAKLRASEELSQSIKEAENKYDDERMRVTREFEDITAAQERLSEDLIAKAQKEYDEASASVIQETDEELATARAEYEKAARGGKRKQKRAAKTLRIKEKEISKKRETALNIAQNSLDASNKVIEENRSRTIESAKVKYDKETKRVDAEYEKKKKKATYHFRLVEDLVHVQMRVVQVTADVAQSKAAQANIAVQKRSSLGELNSEKEIEGVDTSSWDENEKEIVAIRYARNL